MNDHKGKSDMEEICQFGKEQVFEISAASQQRRKRKFHCKQNPAHRTWMALMLHRDKSPTGLG